MPFCKFKRLVPAAIAHVTVKCVRPMSANLELGIGSVCLVVGIMSIRALLDSEHPRTQWAKVCLVVLVFAAMLAGLVTGLEASGRIAQYIRPGSTRPIGSFLRGLTVGLFFALYSSGQWSGKKSQV